MSNTDDSPDRQPERKLDLFGEQLGILAEASHFAPCPAALFDTFVHSVAKVLSADLVQILQCIPHEAFFMLRSGRGFDEDLNDHARVPGGLLSQAGRALLDPQGRPVVLEDFSRPHDWADDELILRYGAKSGVSVKIGNDTEDFGALGVFHRTPRAFPPEEVSFVAQAAALLAGGIGRIRRQETAVAWQSRAEFLRAGAVLARVAADQDALLRAAVLAAVGGGAGGSKPIADWCFADRLEPNGARPTFKRVAFDHAAGAPAHVEEAFSTPLDATAPHGAPRALATRRSELVDRVDEEFRAKISRDSTHRRALEDARPYSYICVPVIGRERFYGALGFLRVETGTPLPYTTADRDACEEFAALVGVAMDSGIASPDIEEAREAVRFHNGGVSGGAYGETPADAALETPTDTEQKVLERLAAGMSVEEVAEDLHLATNTIKTHRRHIREKLGLKPKSTILKLVTEARRQGWLAA